MHKLLPANKKNAHAQPKDKKIAHLPPPPAPLHPTEK